MKENLEKKDKKKSGTSELFSLVRKGRLFDVQKWIELEKPVFDGVKCGKTALSIAVDKGFHSMVDILAAAWPDQKTLNDTLERAASKRQVELVWLLMEKGAKLEGVSPRVIAECCDNRN